jgi:hypothetical protein
MGDPEGAGAVTRWRPVTVLAAIWLALVIGQAARLGATGSLMSGDGVYHFAHLHSLVVDRDLDAANEIRYFQQGARSAYTGRPKIGDDPTRHPVTGAPINKYPIGLALLALPAYALVYAGASALTALGVPADTSGYGPAYQWAAAVLLAAWSTLGLWCCFRVATFAASGEEDGWWATLLAALATPWIFYATLEPFFAHALSAAVASATFLLWLHARRDESEGQGTRDEGRASKDEGQRTKDKGQVKGWFLTGLATGIAGLIRYQDLSLLLVPAGDLILRMLRERGHARQLAALGAGCAIGFAPQLVVNALVLGHPLVTGYAREGFVYWQSPRVLYSLFAADVGFLRWAPIAVPAIGGLVIGARRGWPHARWGLALLAVQIYLVSSWYFYSQGHTFGNRMLVNCTPVIAIGLAALLTSLSRRPRLRLAALVAGIVLVAVNVLLMALWAAGRIGPLSTSYS